MNTSTVSKTVKIGQYFATNCTVTGKPLPYVQWWYNVSSVNDSSKTVQQFINNASIGTTSLVIDSISQEDITTYYCKASFLDVSHERFVTLVLGTKPGLTDAQIAGIVVGALILCVIIIVAIVLVLKKKNITNNPVNNDGQNAKNDISKTEAQKNAKKAKETSKEKTRSSEKGQDQPRGDSALSRQEIYPQLPHSGVTDLLNAGVANEKIDSPRKLPPLTLPPVNKVNPEDDPDDQEQKKKKKKKHKKRHHEEDEGQGVDHEDNGQINTGYDIDRTEN